MNSRQRSRRNDHIRKMLLRTVVWVILVIFIFSSVGAALVVSAAH